MFYRISYSPNCLEQNTIKLVNNCKYTLSVFLIDKIVNLKENEKYNIPLGESEDSCEIILIYNYTKFILNKGMVMYFNSDI